MVGLRNQNSFTPLPAQVDVAVVGGGIIGVTATFFLARQGISVALFDKGVVAGEQSSRNLGWCRTVGRDTAEMPLMLESLDLWRQANTILEAETGFRTTGLLYGYETAADVEAHQDWLDVARAHHVETRILEGREVARLLPGAARQPKFAIHAPGNGRADPAMATHAFANAAMRLGALVFENCAVRGLETAGGRVCGVQTERGKIACGAVLLAGGAWSRAFGLNHGLDLPQLKAVLSAMRTAPMEGGPSVIAAIGSYAVSPRLDGGYTISSSFSTIADIVPDSFRQFWLFLPRFLAERRSIRLRLGRRFVEEWRMPRRWGEGQISPFEMERILSPSPIVGQLDMAMRDLANDFPAFRNAVVAERWAGFVDATPDMLPIICPIEDIPGLVVSTGYSGHGFGLGPAAGRLSADIVTGRTPLVDPTPFRLDRFRRTRAFLSKVN